MKLDTFDTTKSKMQNVKQRFFALRNGIIADTLRRAGAPHRIIFGLNIPQIAAIARVVGYDPELAHGLWQNTATRESRLLAPMIIDPATLTADDVDRLLEIPPVCPEEADALCHYLLRKTAHAQTLIERWCDSDDDMHRYMALRLCFAVANGNPDMATLRQFAGIAERETARDVSLTRAVARQLADHIDFLTESRE